MELTLSEVRIILDALKFKLAHFQKQQALLDDSHESQVAELSNDMYYLELLIECFREEYEHRISEIRDEYHDYSSIRQNRSAFAGVREETDEYSRGSQ